MKKIALILAVSLLFVVSAWAEDLTIWEPEKFPKALYVLKEKSNIRKSMFSDSCVGDSCINGLCATINCTTERYRDTTYEIGTIDGKVIMSITETEKVE